MALEPDGHERPAVLPCGRDPLDVWDDVTAGSPDEHERHCPYCQGVADEHAMLAGPTRALVAQQLRPPPSLLDRVMANVTAARLNRHPLTLPSPYGAVTIDSVTAATILRWAVDDLPDVRTLGCEVQATGRVRGSAPADADRSSGSAIEGGGTSATASDGQEDVANERRSAAAAAPSVAIRVRAEVRMGINVPDTASKLRSTLREVASRLVGLHAERVDVDIVDLFGFEELLKAAGPNGA